MANQVESILNLPSLAIYGLEIANDATTPDEIITISAGMCRDSANNVDIVLGSNFPNANNQTFDAPLSVDITVNGVNGLDAGTVAASKVYAVYVISDSHNYKVTAGLLSLASNSAPTMPFDYDSYRLIGYIVTDSSSDILLMYVTGTGNRRTVQFDAVQATAVSAGNATTDTNVSLLAFVPPVDNTPVYIATAFTPASAGNIAFLKTYGAGGYLIENAGQVASVLLNSYNWIFSKLNSATPSIVYKVSNASDAVTIYVAGFEFVV